MADDQHAPGAAPAAVAAAPDQRGGPVLSVRGLRTTLVLRSGPVDVVRDVSFDIQRGETLGLVGESGCGKSMTALSLLRLVPNPPGRITAGEVWLEGRNLLALPLPEMRRIRGDRISMIFQEPLTSLDPVFTIGSQLTSVIRVHRGVSAAQARELALTMLEEVGIPSPKQRFDAYPHQLSGGMRQRVMIALALALNPTLLVADEPTTALDVTVQAQILDLIKEEQRRRQMAVLLITHNLAVVAEAADRVAVMYAGEIVETAPTTQFFAAPRHPYSQGLLRALPRLDAQQEQLHVIPGQVPDPRQLPPACLFAPRCPFALDRCWQEKPYLESPDGGHHAFRCWNPQPFQ